MAAKRQAKRIAIYNHKGGVGKTTLTINIAAALATHRKRVLLVDSDPQCNLTAYLCDDKTVDQLLNNSEKPAGQTLWSALKPVYDEEGDIREVEVLSTDISRVDLLPGDIRLSEFEETLSDAWAGCFRRKPGAIRATTAIRRIVNRYQSDYDYIFFDTGPNIGALNRILLLDCDAFLVPVACDLFSTRALSTLGQSIKKWVIDWRTLQMLTPAEFDIPPGTPRFSGFIPQRFKIYGRVMTNEAAGALSHIQRRIVSDVVAVLKEVDPKLVPTDSATLRLGDVQDFANTALLAQKQGVPIFEVQGGNPDHVASARAIFSQIAQRIIKAI